MAKSPKLKIISPLRYTEEICSVEQAKDMLFRSNGVLMYIVIEGKLIQSYEQLVKVISQEQYKDREFLVVREIPFIAGGG